MSFFGFSWLVGLSCFIFERCKDNWNCLSYTVIPENGLPIPHPSFLCRNKIVLYCILSHVLKNTANQRPGLPLHILRYATGNMQRVVVHSPFPSLLARNSLPGSIWWLLKSQLRNSSTPANHYEQLRSRPEFSEDFRTLPRISEDFPKILKSHKNIWKLLLNRFCDVSRNFPKISEHFRRFPKISRKF